MSPKNQKQELYIGPRPFEFEDKGLFFGREREASELLSLTIAHRVMLIYAQSGAGKTSLINTRLKPDLESEGFEVLNIVRMQVPLPVVELDKIDNIYVYKTLLNLISGESSYEKLKKKTLSTYLIERKPKIDKDGYSLPCVIIFDQFEELFNLHADRWEDRKSFFIQIRDAIEQLGKDTSIGTPPLWVIFSMREDYIANLDQYAIELPGKLSTRYRLERLREDAALQAIRGPLKNNPVSFERGVAEKLVEKLLKVKVEAEDGERREIKGEFVEPVQLQLVCQSLLRNLPTKFSKIRLEHLERFGDVDKALSRFYDDVVQNVAKITFVDENTLRDWFENVLITPTGTRGTVFRGPVSTVGIPNDAVDILESRHIIRAEYRAGARWYELTHDRFIDPIKESNKTFYSKNAGQREIDGESQKAIRFYKQGEQAQELGDYDTALKLFNKAQYLYNNIGDKRGIANALTSAGNIYLLDEKFDKAIDKFEETLTIFKIIDDRWGIIYTLTRIARIYEKTGNVKKATQFRKDAIVEAAQVSKNDKEAARYFERLKREDAAFKSKEEEFKKERERYLRLIGNSFFDNVLSSVPSARAAYDDVMAYMLASMSQLVYDRFEEGGDAKELLAAKLKVGGFVLIECFSSMVTDTHAFLAVKRNSYAVLAFRGEKNWRDIQTDIRARRIKTPKGKIHGGFKNAFASIEPEIKKSLASVEGIPLYITGHSMGGALATIATQVLEWDSPFTDQIAACYTYGSPRIGNDAYDSSIKSMFYRVVNTTDIVSILPIFSMGYIHIGDVRFLGREYGTISRSIPIMQRTFLFLAGIFKPLVDDHAISQYRKKLEAIAQDRNIKLFLESGTSEK